MLLENFFYDRKNGWSCETFPDLDSDNSLLIVFGGAAYLNDTAPIVELKKRYPKAHLIGCSTAGEISNELIHDDSLTVALLKFEKTNVKTARANVATQDESYDAGKKIAATLDSDDLSAIFVLSDGLNVNGSELVKGLHKHIGEHVIVTGGLAGDADRFANTWTLYRDESPASEQVVAVGLYGNSLKVGFGSQGGWDIFGPERIITRSEGNVLYEIDDKPALALYKEYLGERASELPASGLLFPLGIRENSESANQLVRTILSVDEEEQSMTFAGDIPMGWRGQLMRANYDRLIDGAHGAACMASHSETDEYPTLAIAISCVGRRLVLGQRSEEEVEACLDVFPEKTKQIGFYSYGEISPLACAFADLHNQTMTLTTFREE